MILRVQVGSGVHGTSVSGQDDRDEMGLCLEPPRFVTGLARVPNGTGGQGPSVRFEQYERHTAWDRPGGVANRSGAGDLDVIIYSARKWARLALAGNPTVLLVLFVPDEEVVFRNEAGAELAANAHRFVSRLAAGRFLGYLTAQKAAMTGQAGAHTNRPELVAADVEMAVPWAEFEEMCYFFAHLSHERYGSFPKTGSGISRESCSNPAGWPR
jgi:uncharacterized protein